MIEQEIDLEIFAAHFQGVLTADKREADAELQEKLPNVLQETALKVFFMSFAGEGQEIKVVWIFEKLLGQVGLRGRKGRCKIGQCLSLTSIQAGFDLHDENVSTPAVLNCLLYVPEALCGVLHKIEKSDIVAPRQFCKAVAKLAPQAKPRRKPS